MGPMLGRVLALSAGGVLGVNARYWLGVWISKWASPQFPWATFVINVSGSFAIGFLTVLLARWLPHPNVRMLLLVGFLGGYTTFSTFAYESATLLERGETGLAVANLAGSVGAGFVAVMLGISLARGLTAAAEDRKARPDDTPAARSLPESHRVVAPPPATPGSRSRSS